ncbi:MAG: PAS domain-containing protein [Actinomycetota bacterium]|nr:PAS domain-containing protein [Actinomycetota bacterium]
MPKSDGANGRHGVPGGGEVGGAFRLLLAANPLPMWVYDLETLRFLEVNDAAVAHYGYTRAEFLEMSIAHVAPAPQIATPLGTRACFRPTRPPERVDPSVGRGATRHDAGAGGRGRGACRESGAPRTSGVR